MPVTTPIAKLIRKILPKNFVARSHFSFPVRTHAVCIPATSQTSPKVIGTKKKWYTVVMPNCHRARSKTSMAILVCTDRPERPSRAQPPTTTRTRGADHRL